MSPMRTRALDSWRSLNSMTVPTPAVPWRAIRPGATTPGPPRRTVPGRGILTPPGKPPGGGATARRNPPELPTARPRRAGTVYKCAPCGTRLRGDQRCGCGTFMHRIGLGGICP